MPRTVSLARRALRAPRESITGRPYVCGTTHRFDQQYPCFYCPRGFKTDRQRAQHVALSSRCRQAEELRNLLGVRDNVRLVTFAEPEPEPQLDVHLQRNSSRDPSDGVLLRNPMIALPPSPPIPEPFQSFPHPVTDGSHHLLVYDKRRRVFVEKYPDPRAGAPINDEVVQPLDLKAFMASAGNLGDPDYFDTAELLMTTGLTNAGRDAHLKSRLYKGHVPWPNNRRLISDIDKLPHGPDWTVYDIKLSESGQRPERKHSSYLFMRSVVATLRDLMANPEHKDYMHYAPRRDWTAEDRACRVYGETCSGNWWWEMQESKDDKFATLVPLFVSWDRAELSVMSGGQTVYPVLLTLGNIDKSVRRKLSMRATALLAYLPVERFANVQNKKERSRLKRQLLHRALEKLFGELNDVAGTGIVVACADGRYRRAYPILAGVMLDYEEQAPSAVIKRYKCPKCLSTESWRDGNLGPPRSNDDTLDALRSWLVGDGRDRADALGLQDSPIWPWWAHMPDVDFGGSVMPNLLHQLHQGMIRHLIRWTLSAAGEEIVNRYFMNMPAAEGMRHFRQGITGLTQWTGRESKEATKQLLPIIASLGSKNWNSDFVRLARALIDFVYRAQASRMTDDDLTELEQGVSDIHKYKSVLVRMKIFKDDSRFDKIIKLHMLSHYSGYTRRKGTPDGFSTETPEHSHIESKQAWHASNKVRPTPQMINFLQRYEALRIHRARMNAYLGRLVDCNGKRSSHVVYGEDEDQAFYPAGGHVMSGSSGARFGQEDRKSDNIIMAMGTNGGQDDQEGIQDEAEDEEQQHFAGQMRTAAEAREHVVYPNPTLSIALKPTVGRVRGIDIIAKYGARDLVSALHVYLKKHGTRQLPSDFLPTAYHEYPVWHRLYLRHDALPFDPEWPRRDVIRARPVTECQDSAFDVALLLEDREKFGLHLSPNDGLYTLSHSRLFDGKRRAVVVPALDVAAACHLAPRFERLESDDGSPFDFNSLPDMLDSSRYFWFNHYYNCFIYRLVEHWRSERAT